MNTLCDNLLLGFASIVGFYRHCVMFLGNRLIRILCLQYYCIVLLGAPVPIVNGEAVGQTEESQQTFPCAGGTCGCSFEHCWSSCCCHTLAERLNWARKNNVRPPKAAIKEALRAGLDVSSWNQPNRKDLSCKEEDAKQLRKCCETGESQTKPNIGQHADNAHEWKGVVIVKAMSCRGIAFAWSTIAAAPPPCPIDFSPQQVFTQLDVAQTRLDLPNSPQPPTPPPRSALVPHI